MYLCADQLGDFGDDDEADLRILKVYIQMFKCLKYFNIPGYLNILNKYIPVCESAWRPPG
jgi:hypothetical protein